MIVAYGRDVTLEIKQQESDAARYEELKVLNETIRNISSESDIDKIIKGIKTMP